MNYSMWLIGAGMGCVMSATAADGTRHRLSVGPSLLLNARVSLQLSPGGPADPSAAALQNREYDDGYNRVDDSDNFDGRTSYYGYRNASQVDLTGDTLSLHNAGLATPFKTGRESSPMPGIEARYGYQFGGGDKWQWGLEAGAGWFAFDETVRGSGPASIRLLTDEYDLGGVVPPPAPYEGTFETGPGLTRIDDTPNRTVTTEAGTASARGEVEGNLWLLRLGPWAEWRASERFSFALHGGFALVGADFSVRATSTIDVPGVVSLDRSARASEFEWLPGGYVGVDARYDLGRDWSVAIGGDWLCAGSTTFAGAGTRTKLDLSNAIVIKGALGWSF